MSFWILNTDLDFIMFFFIQNGEFKYGRKGMHMHTFKEVTDYFQGDDFLHVFECECGFTIAEKKRLVKTGSRQKKMMVYTVMRKREKKE